MEFSIERMEKVAEILAEEIGEKLASEQDIDGMGGMLRELVKEAGRLGLQKAIEQGEERNPSREVRCACEKPPVLVGKRWVVVWTVFGKVNYQRRYYHCRECHQGQSPLDQAYGITPGQATSGLASLLGVLGVEVAFEEASQLAERFLLFKVSDNTVRKQTEGYGHAQAQTEKEWIRTAEDEQTLRMRERRLDKRGGRVYASLDGAHVPVQDEWRELKTLCWYQVEPIQASRPKNHHGSRVGEQSHLQAKTMKYYCDIQEAEQFGRLVWATGLQNQVDTYEEIVFVWDGVLWNITFHKLFKSWTGIMPANISCPSPKPPLAQTHLRHRSGLRKYGLTFGKDAFKM